MLTDTKLKSLKPQAKLYKVSDRDGLYVAVSPGGTVSFRYDYRINGRRETLTIGKYGSGGITLAEARDRLGAAKKMLDAGESPAAKKREGKSVVRNASRFTDFVLLWKAKWEGAASTLGMRQATIDNHITPKYGRMIMKEITPTMLREHCEKIRDNGAPATAVLVRDIVSKVFRFAQARGYEGDNPAEKVPSSSIATFKPRDRSLSEEEIGVFFNALNNTANAPSMRMLLKLLFLTMLRKNELQSATWDMVDFKKRTLTVPASIMKMSRPHIVYLSNQAYDILVGLNVIYGNAAYIHPGRFGDDKTLSAPALNTMINKTIQGIKKQGGSFEHFTVHDLRRTASTLLHEAGFNTDWIEKCLAHEQRGVRAVYNKAEYAEQRRDMLQQWADMVDGWIEKEKG